MDLGRTIAGLSLAPLARSIRGGLEPQIGHQEEIDNIQGIIGLIDQDRSPAWGGHDELAMVDRHLPSVRKMDDKRAKGRGVVKGAHLLDGQGSGSKGCRDGVSESSTLPRTSLGHHEVCADHCVSVPLFGPRNPMGID